MYLVVSRFHVSSAHGLHHTSGSVDSFRLATINSRNDHSTLHSTPPHRQRVAGYLHYLYWLTYVDNKWRGRGLNLSEGKVERGRAGAGEREVAECVHPVQGGGDQTCLEGGTDDS